jgi:iron complex outermembrane receptor protein
MSGSPGPRWRANASTALLLAALVPLSAAGRALGAQAAIASLGVLSGRVTQAPGDAPVGGARVQVFTYPGNVAVGSTTTGPDGRYRLPGLRAGQYAVVVTRIGFQLRRVETVRVSEGEVATANVGLSELASTLDAVVVTSSRAPEKVLDAPASISVVSAERIERTPAVTVVDQVRNQPGIDATKGGVAQTNVVARGFNNAFSGSLLMLQDYRFAGVPSLRVNVPFLSMGVSEDVERIEVLLGPAAALYGPNSANGVMHVITKSPFTSQGTTFTVDGGERSLFRGAIRHAQTVGDKVGFKVSGEYFTANDFQFRDRVEPDSFPAAAPQGRANRLNRRDFDVERFSGEARLDVRPTNNSEAITTVGYSRVGSLIELTGANGASQIRNWSYTNLQQRFRYKRVFAQAFANLSDAGNRDSVDTRGTFLLRSGQPIVDQSRVFVGQIQHAFDAGSRQNFIYGADYIFTNPRTAGTTNGINEGDDNVTEYGGYVQGVTHLTPKVDFIAAARLDRNDRIDGVFFSPRAALTFKPTQTSNFRLTFNRAFQTPGNFQMFLDLVQARTAFANVRAQGVDPVDGFRFARNSPTGVGGLFMRTSQLVPAALGGPNQRVDANAATFFPLYIAAANGSNNALVTRVAQGLQQAGLPAQNAAALAGQVVANLAAARPTAAQVGTVLRVFNPTTAAATPSVPFPRALTSLDSIRAFVRDESPLEPSFVNNFEAGYKGIFANKFRVTVDGWYQQRFNFITPAQVITPTVFGDPATLGGFIAGNVAATLAPSLGAAGAATFAGQLAQGLVPSLAGIPLGNVLPEGRRYQRNDVVFTYRNVDQRINVAGTDVAADYLLTPRLTLAGTYSYVDRGAFRQVEGGNGEPLRLNAPQHKGSAAVQYDSPVNGWAGELRYRYTDAFRVNSAVYLGDVPTNNFVDLSVSKAVPINGRQARVSVNATNLFDNRRPTFIGTPDIGRLVITRVSYTL